MPRPYRCRHIGFAPDFICFGPRRGNCGHRNEKGIVLSPDELETIRLLDYEGLNQEACAQKMNIGRTTVTAIYARARQKVAKALCEANDLWLGNPSEKVNLERKGCCHHDHEEEK